MVSKTEYILMLLVIFIFSTATFKRNLVWQDELTLWADSSAKSPHKARPHNNTASALINMGRYDEALERLERALEADPWYIEPHYNKAICYIRKRLFDQAVPELEEVLRINRVLKRGHHGARISPRYELEAHANLGNIYNLRGEYDKAIFHYKEALKINPQSPSIHYNLALTYKRLGMVDEARTEFEEVLKIDPSDPGARWNLKVLEAQ